MEWESSRIRQTQLLTSDAAQSARKSRRVRAICTLTRESASHGLPLSEFGPTRNLNMDRCQGDGSTEWYTSLRVLATHRDGPRCMYCVQAVCGTTVVCCRWSLPLAIYPVWTTFQSVGLGSESRRAHTIHINDVGCCPEIGWRPLSLMWCRYGRRPAPPISCVGGASLSPRWDRRLIDRALHTSANAPYLLLTALHIFTNNRHQVPTATA